MPDKDDHNRDRSELVQRLLDVALREVQSQALVLLDPDGVIVGWLAGSERLFGYRPEEIVGRNAEVIFTPEDLERDLSAWELKTAAASGESEDDRWQVRKDGGRIWVSGTLTALRDPRDGKLLGFCKLMRNRTDQKSQVQTLEGRVDALMHAEQRKNTFIATLAHELRTPLNAVSASAQLLAAECESISPDSAFALDTVRRQIEAMGRLVQDLLDVARAATGKVHLHKERIILQEVIAQAVEACRPSFERRAQVLRQSLVDVPISLDADSGRLRQILVNLLENASKYTPERGTIWIKATTEGDDAVVRVQDTGIGIAAEVMPHIFDLFTQAIVPDHAESAESAARAGAGGRGGGDEGLAGASAGGLGIGLSVVRDTVALHGGVVQATSDGPGKGSEFTIRLPLPQQQGQSSPRPTAP
jgi:PAS domain S-box-containing protein